MIINAAKYAEIKRCIEQLITKGIVPTIEIANSLNFEYNALCSLFNQFQVRSIKREIKKFDSKTMHRIIERVHTNEVLSAIAHEYGFSAYKLASMYLDIVYAKTITIRSLAENPHQLVQYHQSQSLTAEGSRYTVTEGRLQVITQDILSVCYAQDSSSSWESEVCKQCIGM